MNTNMNDSKNGSIDAKLDCESVMKPQDKLILEKILALPEPKRSELIALIVLIAEYEAGGAS